jgi:hypothetical protein
MKRVASALFPLLVLFAVTAGAMAGFPWPRA